MNLRRLTLFELKDKFLKGEVSAVEIVKVYFQRLMLAESKVKAYITTAKKDALVKEANELDYSLSKWRKTMPLMAMPIAHAGEFRAAVRCHGGGPHERARILPDRQD